MNIDLKAWIYTILVLVTFACLILLGNYLKNNEIFQFWGYLSLVVLMFSIFVFCVKDLIKKLME